MRVARSWGVRLALALFVAGAVAQCGGKGGGTVSSDGSVSTRVAAARRALCHDLIQFGGGAFRVPNLQRVLPKLKTDETLLVRAGDKSSAQAVRRLAGATRKLIAALQRRGCLRAANQARVPG